MSVLLVSMSAAAATLWRQTELPSAPAPSSLASMAERAADSLRSAEQRVCCFESTTGGLIQASLLASPGASQEGCHWIAHTFPSSAYSPSPHPDLLSTSSRRAEQWPTHRAAASASSARATRALWASRWTPRATGRDRRTPLRTSRASRSGPRRSLGVRGSSAVPSGASPRTGRVGPPLRTRASARDSPPSSSPVRLERRSQMAQARS